MGRAMVWETRQGFKNGSRLAWRSPSSRRTLIALPRRAPGAGPRAPGVLDLMNARMWNRAAIVIAVAVVAVGAPWFAGQIKSLPASSLERRSAQRIVTLDVAGMTCDRCERAVRGQLAEVPGVSTVEVRYRERRAF